MTYRECLVPIAGEGFYEVIYSGIRSQYIEKSAAFFKEDIWIEPMDPKLFVTFAEKK
jgi:hypothetical protein